MSLVQRVKETLKHYSFLGFTSFGGPNVHFLILSKLFVTKLEWIDDTTFADLLSIGTASPGPASTTLAFSIAFLHAGWLGAFIAMVLWIGPGAIGMFSLGLGVSHISNTLPELVYRLLTGVNAVAVGLIFGAGYSLSSKIVTDKWTLAIVFLSGSIATLYSAQWLFPVLMATGGSVTWLVDSAPWNRWSAHWKRSAHRQHTNGDGALDVEMETQSVASDLSNGHISQRRVPTSTPTPHSSEPGSDANANETSQYVYLPSFKVGIAILVFYFLFFITIMVVEAVVPNPPLAFSLFRNMLLAGTIIFGGGPVVIPLLTEYVVSPGWVSSRDFLLGLAVLQGFPGPNFNFAAYLGCLTLQQQPVAGAILGVLGIFLPGLSIRAGIIPIWSFFRRRPAMRSILRGVAAGAIGLIWAALVTLSKVAITSANGTSDLFEQPFFVVVAAGGFVACEWFKCPPFLAVILGGVAGIIQYAVSTA